MEDLVSDLTVRVAPRDVVNAAISLGARGARLTNDSAPGTRASLVELTLGIAPRDVFSAAISHQEARCP